MSTALIGLDIGTSSVKAAAFDRRGRLLAAAASPIALHVPAPGWAEQEPGDWWQAACRVLREVTGVIAPARPAAIGLSGQCPGHVLAAADGRPIGRAIIWRDQRAVEQAAWLGREIAPARAREWVGTEFLGDPGCPPARLLWLKAHRPDDWAAAATVLQPKDFIALQLTGRACTDRHSAYCLAHSRDGRYHPDYFSHLGLEVGKMPPALEPTQSVGGLTELAARLTGLPAGTPVIVGTIDAYCDNLAGGVLLPGRAVDVSGTSEIVSLAVEGQVEARGVFPASLADGSFLCGPTQAGGDTLAWLSGTFFAQAEPKVDYNLMESEARRAPAGSDGLVFLPYLNGERAPLWDPSARGAFFGLTFGHERPHCARAVYEGVAYAVRHILETAEAAAGCRAEELVVCGGGSRSAFWNQVKADVLQRPVRAAAVSETGCLGAAILAGVGTGLQPDLRSACQAMIRFGASFQPDPASAQACAAGYRTYLGLYPALQALSTGTAA